MIGSDSTLISLLFSVLLESFDFNVCVTFATFQSLGTEDVLRDKFVRYDNDFVISGSLSLVRTSGKLFSSAVFLLFIFSI